MWEMELDRDGGRPLRRQIYEGIRQRIENGVLSAGEALPSTRALAKALNASRGTVGEAYDMLIAEGYVVSRQGAPTRVAEGLCVETTAAPAAHAIAPARPAVRADFRTGMPDLNRFPRYLWRHLMAEAAADLPIAQYGYAGPQGLPALREEIAAWLARGRGLAVHPDDIFITAGATHALHLLAELICPPGKSIAVEDPCHTGMRDTFLARGCAIAPVSADDRGIDPRALPDGRGVCAVYVTPSHQFPMGGILPASRRAALVRYARENDLFVIEDDYDSEFRYAGDPVAPLHAMDPARVIYVGTFSKTVFPALRIGYVILPARLHAAWRAARMHDDVQNPPFEQAALAEFMRTRKLDRHLRDMRKLYGQRRQALLDALTEAFGGEYATCGDAAGLHVAVDFPGRRFDGAFRARCREAGIVITPLEDHCIEKGRHLGKLLLGYGHLEVEEIKKAVPLLAEVIRAAQAR